jgi:hypothetical protein
MVHDAMIKTEHKPLGRLCRMLNTFLKEFPLILIVHHIKRNCWWRVLLKNLHAWRQCKDNLSLEHQLVAEAYTTQPDKERAS